MTPTWSTSCAQIQIKADVNENKALSDVVKFFLPDKKDESSEKSIKFITTAFVHEFMLALPKKGKLFIQDFINAKVADEVFLTQWIDVVYGNKSDEELHNLFKNAAFFHIFENLKTRDVSINLNKFYFKMRIFFKCCFEEATNLTGIIEIYRDFLKCKTDRSLSFNNAAKKLWKKLKLKDDILNLAPTEGALLPVHTELLQKVENFQSTDNVIIINRIKEIFPEDKISFESADKKLLISGNKIMLSQIYCEIFNKMAMGKERINEMEIKAHEFILDRDFVLPGKNLIIITKTLKIPKNVEINLSGKHATLTTGAAKNGMIAGEDGEDGKNGIAGESSGNCLILTQTITDKEKENLRILLNGGNGSKGQDGGAGADGEDGVGAEVDMIEKDKIKIIFKNAVNFLTAGGFSRTLDSEYATVINDGPTKFANDSANFFATHSYRLYKGSDGKPGGEGGRKGIGGEGGKCGTLKFTIGGHDKSIEGEKLQAKDGCDGQNGKDGKPGKSGMQGWDIAITEKTFRKGKIYGQFKNKSLRIEYVKIPSDDTVFVKDRFTDENGFECYAKIVEEDLQRTQLVNFSGEKTQKKNERKNESAAQKKCPIDEEVGRENYQILTQTELNDQNKENNEDNMEYEELTEINRILDFNFVECEEENEYVPKEKYEPRIITAQEIKNIQNTKEGWDLLWKFPSEVSYSFNDVLFKRAPDDSVRCLLANKKLIGKIRNDNDDEENIQQSRHALINEFQEKFEQHYANQITSDAESMKTKIQRISVFFGENGKYLCKKLELLFLQSTDTSVAITNTFLLIFEAEGMHIDLITMNYLIETIFVFAHSHPYMFPSVLLSTEQSQWVDEIFMLVAETKFDLTVESKAWLKKSLTEFADENLKILFSEKLQKQEEMQEGHFKYLINAMTGAKTMFPYLENVDLKGWEKTIDKWNLKSIPKIKDDLVNMNEEKKLLATFYYNKLVDKFGQVTIIPLFNQIIEMVDIMDKQVLGLFIQRLCKDEIVCGTINEESANIKDIFMYCLKIQKNEINETDKQVESCVIVKELLTVASKESRKPEDIHILCQKLNKSEHFSKIIEILKQSTEFENEIEKSLKMLKQNKNDSYDFSFAAFTKNFVNLDYKIQEIKHFIFLLKVVDKVVFQQNGFYLRENQKLAILCALNNKSDKGKTQNILQQIATGEGKTLIIAVLSIILVLKNQKNERLKVNIVTSSSVLAKREIESKNGCLALYKAFGLKAGHICNNSKKIRTDIYTKCDIIYGDLTTYQSDFLEDKYLDQNISGGRNMNVVIVDEVDSMLLDNGLNMLYLSHDIAELELLQPILTKIWQFTNLRLKGDLKDCTNDDDFYHAVSSSIFSTISWTDLHKILDITVKEAKEFQTSLISKKIVDENGIIFTSNRKKLRHTIKFCVDNIKDKIKNKFLCYCDMRIKEKYNKVPTKLRKFVIKHLKEFISTAEAAFQMNVGINYQLETVSNLYTRTLESRIVIIDTDTGVDLPTTQWTKGMHQFLQLKHGLRLTPISTKAVYISNVSYLKKYGNILGFTGTLGGEAEKEELNELYTVKENGTVTHEFKCYTLPSSHPKQFYEEPTVLANSEQNFFVKIFNALKIQIDKGRSALVIADSVKLVEILNREIKRIANEELKGEELNVFLNAIMYKRDFEKFKYADGTTLLPPQMIIFSTNLAGRGTDIKILKKLEENGGLHVIVAFLPQNIRIEEQAYGRAGRSGESGTAQMIIYEKTETDIVQLKRKRNEKETARIQKIKEHYLSQIVPEEECFAQFSKLAKEFRIELQRINLPKEYQDILCKDIFDQYALELDANIEKISEWNIQNFCNDLKVKYVNNNMKPLQSSNILKYAAKLAYEKKYEEANEILKLFSCHEYMPEQKYYSVIYNIKNRKDKTLLNSIENSLKEAKNGFVERLILFAANVSMTDSFKIQDDDFCFYTDDFQQQQQQCEHLTLAFIESIDQFLGQMIEPTDFFCETLNTEASMLVYENLRNYKNSPITGYTVCKNYDEVKLKDYCEENGISFENVKKDLKPGESIPEETLRGLFQIQTYQKFWAALKAKYLVDKKSIRAESFIDTTKVSPLTEQIIQQYVDKDYKFPEDHILEYPYVKEWEHLKCTKDIQSLLECFEMNNIIQKTEFAQLISEPSEATKTLNEPLTFNDICAYGFSKEIDLIQLGILESSNVNLGALEENIPNGNFYHNACSFSLKSNPCQHYYRALTLAQTTIKKTFSKSQHHKDIVSNASKEQIENVLREKAAALQKYENLDIQFVPIEDILNNLKLDALKVKPIIHTLPYLIIPSEMKWSKKTIITLGVVGSGAAIQIAAGIGLVVATLGIGAFAGKFMVAEGEVQKFCHFRNIKQKFSGLSDAMFCEKGLWHGKTDNFLRYKMTSIAISVVLCGLTEPLKYVKAIPSILSRDAVSVIRKADIFIVGGGGSLLRTILPSFGEIKNCEKTKNLISEAINYTNCDVYGRLILIIEGIFRNTELLEITLTELYKKVGFQNTEKIFEKECVDFGRSADSVLISMSSFIVAEVSRNCISHSTLINYSVVISKIMASQKFQQFLTNVKDKFSISMINIHETLKKRLEESSFEFEAEERINEKELIKKVIETTKSRLHEKYKSLVEEKITRPLNERNNMVYQNKIRKIASAQNLKTVIESAQTNQTSSLNFNEKLIAKFKLEYLAKLENFLNSTKNAEIFAELILTTPKTHQIGVNSIAKLLSFYKKRKVTVNITTEDKIFSNTFPNTPGDSIILKVDQEDSVKTLCDKLYEKVPEIQFKSYENFKADLIKVIEADFEFRNR